MYKLRVLCIAWLIIFLSTGCKDGLNQSDNHQIAEVVPIKEVIISSDLDIEQQPDIKPGLIEPIDNFPQLAPIPIFQADNFGGSNSSGNARTGNKDEDDRCQDDPLKTEPGLCGCGTPDMDADKDGLLVCFDCDDNNPNFGPFPQDPLRYLAPNGNDNGGSNNCLDKIHPCLTIAHAISQADPGDTLFLAAGNFLEYNLLVNKSLFIIGQGPDKTIIDAQQNDQVFKVNSNRKQVGFCGLTIKGGNTTAQNGGGIFSDNSIVDVSNCHINNNHSAISGGGIANNFTEFSILNSQVNNNSTDNFGGGMFSTNGSSLPMISNTIFSAKYG